MRTSGDSIRRVETSLGTPQTIFRQPAGKPASWKMRASATIALGDSSGPFSTSVHPQASAAAILWTAWLNGKFQGENAAHTPIGSRNTVCVTAGRRAGTIRP